MRLYAWRHGQVLELVGIDIGGHDPGPLAGEAQGGSTANTLAGSSDQCGFVLESHGKRFLLVIIVYLYDRILG
ncbi:hypothetical protein GCM10007160_30770 [Litchfieldella qijiaojingensis]|uniref:Uncharacterized protein n=1 Tax=Litchfieldella qijiaojingensis TaxID=980347 RepID=A0ABQ2Z3R9_9GAMM|nr:hypothetical protein GCM10007160_30770 [Halomonas qijiaojingensis]